VQDHLVNYKLKNLREQLNITDQAEKLRYSGNENKDSAKMDMIKLSIMLQTQRSESKIIRERLAVVHISKCRT
jgi:hypothetical protein